MIRLSIRDVQMITKEKVKKEIDRIPDNLLEDIYSYIQYSMGQTKKSVRSIHTYKLAGQFDEIDIRANAYE